MNLVSYFEYQKHCLDFLEAVLLRPGMYFVTLRDLEMTLHGHWVAFQQLGNLQPEISNSWRRNRITCWAATSRKNARRTCQYDCAFSNMFRSNILRDFIHPNRSIQVQRESSFNCRFENWLHETYGVSTCSGWAIAIEMIEPNPEANMQKQFSKIIGEFMPQWKRDLS